MKPGSPGLVGTPAAALGTWQQSPCATHKAPTVSRRTLLHSVISLQSLPPDPPPRLHPECPASPYAPWPPLLKCPPCPLLHRPCRLQIPARPQLPSRPRIHVNLFEPGCIPVTGACLGRDH
jgi:hypothetical protein